MSANVQAKHKVSRRLGINLWGDPKSPFNIRPTKPGQHGKNTRKRKISSYGAHLIEKQKIQFFYDMKEKQFKRFFKNAYKTKNVVETFFGDLESRLDTIVFRAKWASTIFAAKQMIKHRHILVNGKVVNISSYLAKAGDVVSLVEKMRNHTLVLSSLERAHKEVPTYYDTGIDNKALTYLKRPTFEEIGYPFALNPLFIVEFYSRRM